MKRIVFGFLFLVHALPKSVDCRLTVIQAQYNPPTAGLVSWWKGEGNGIDSVGGHNGTVGSLVSFVPGVSGQAFSFPGGYGDS